jgi:PKD domain
MALTAGLVLAGAVGASPGWQVPVAISTGDRALGAELALNAAGDAIVVWDEESGPDCAADPAALSCVHLLEAASRTQASSVWGAPVEITRPGVGALPQVAINAAGDGAITWIHDIGRDRVLQACIRRGVSGSWPHANDLSDAVLQIRNERIGLDDRGDAIAVWAQRVDTAFVVHAEVRPSAIGVWSSATRLSSPGADASGGPVLGLTPGGRAFVAWVENGVVRVSSGDLRTGAWEPAVSLSPSGGAQGEPALAVNAVGDAAVAWSAHAGGVDVVQVASFAAGAGWGPALDLGSGAPPAEPQVALDAAGLALVLWRGDADGEPRSAGQVPGGAWTRAVTIDSGGALEPRLAVASGGNAVAAWTHDDVIEVALHPAASGAWLPAAELSASGSSGPRVSMNAGGDAVVVWIRQASGRLVLEGTELAGDGPLLDHLKVPKTGRARTRLAFRIEPVAWKAPLAGRPTWRFGDGASATGAHVRHAYKKAGRYHVSVTQSDAAGGTATATATVVVKRQRRVRSPA